MEIFDSSYYIINKRLLRIFGLWPYLSRLRKNVSVVVFTIIALSLMIPMMAGLCKAWGKDKIVVMENAIGILYCLVAYSKYFSCYIFEDRIKLVYEQIVEDWQLIQDKEEMNILHQFSQKGRFLTIVYLCCAIFGIFVFTGFPYVAFALDVIFPANKPHKRIYLQQPNYFVIDDMKYYYELFLFHGSPVAATVTLAGVAIDSMVATSIMHACGLFAIVCYRLKGIGRIEKSERHGETNLVSDDEVYDSVMKVCDMHRNSLKSVDRIENSFSISLLSLMLASSIGIAMLMFDTLLNLHVPLKFSIGIVFIIGVKICLFYMSWLIQEVINSSEEVFTSAYQSEWYNLSVDARKLIFIIMQKSLNPCRVMAGNICEMNVQTFATVVKASISYVMVMMKVHSKEEIRRI